MFNNCIICSSFVSGLSDNIYGVGFYIFDVYVFFFNIMIFISMGFESVYGLVVLMFVGDIGVFYLFFVFVGCFVVLVFECEKIGLIEGVCGDFF